MRIKLDEYIRKLLSTIDNNGCIEIPDTPSIFDIRTFREFKTQTEKEFILRKLEKNNWNVSQTAFELEIQRSHLYNKIEQYNLKRM